jgi:hypothetical protein
VCVCRFSRGTCWIDRFERLGARTRIRAASCWIYFTGQRFCCLIITSIERLVVILLPISCFYLLDQYVTTTIINLSLYDDPFLAPPENYSSLPHRFAKLYAADWGDE